MSSNQDTNNSSSNRQRHERRSRRNRNSDNNDDPDAAFKEQIKAERRAQVRQNARDQDQEHDVESSEAAIGDNLEAGNVASVPRTSGRNNNGRERGAGSGSSSSRNGRRRHHNRPAKGPSAGAPAQVGAVATAGRAFGAPRRPPSAPNNTTRSLAGDNYVSSDEEDPAYSRNTKEAVAMNAVTVEDHEREKRRRRKVQEEASRLTQEIKEESSNNKKDKKKPYRKEMAFAVAEEEANNNTDDDADAEKEEERPDDSADSARRWKKIALCLGCVLLLVIIAAIVVFVLQRRSTNDSTITTDSMTMGPTSSPFPGVTPSPTSSPSSAPTFFPTTYLEYDPPSKQDCERIAAGLPIAGEDKMLDRSFAIPMEVDLLEGNDIEPLLPQLQIQIEKLFVPDLIGCPRDWFASRRRLVGSKTASNANLSISTLHRRRKLQSVANIRYAIGTASVTVTLKDGGACEKSSSPNCSVVTAKMDLKVKGDYKLFLLIMLIGSVFPNETDLRPHLELYAPFNTIIIGTIESVDPTSNPTASPTMVPTPTPSFWPTRTPPPTPGPTRPPTPGPTPNPTPQPTPPIPA